ncbi:MFS transporter [Agaribacter flavus]|uniref:MFS transporter n=1 Tax=Agaribacter flavus TaxID=1902781 RepID=A0ABV7FKG3_9ALTE
MSSTSNLSLRREKYALGLGFIAVFFSHQTVNTLAIPYYQMTLGVDPFWLGLAMTIPVIVACSFGPWIGKMSDNHQGKLGRRRPFIYVFPWLSAIFYACIWLVPPAWDSTQQLIYFFIATQLFYLLATCWIVPLNCMAYEVTNDKHERTRVYGSITYFTKAASLFSQWLIPLAQLSVFGGLSIGIKYVGLGVAICLIALLAMVPATFVRTRAVEPCQQKMPTNKLNVFTNIRSAFKVRGLRLIMAIIFFQTLLGVYAASMDYYLIVYYMFDGDISQGAKWKGVLSTSYAVVAILGIWLITRCSILFGKVQTFRALFALACLGGLAKWFIFVPGAQLWLVLDAAMGSLVWLGVGVLGASMLADQIELDYRKNGIKREGIILSCKNWLVQIALALALVLSGLSLNIFGFDAGQGSTQDETSILCMRILLSIGTVISSLVGILLCNRYQQAERVATESRSYT